MANALDKHVVLTGFMGAGKTTIGESVARRLDRPFIDLDYDIGRFADKPIEAIFEEDGEETFRRIEFGALRRALGRPPAVIGLGGGAVTTPAVRHELARAFVVHLEVEVDEAWRRVQGTRRPLARDKAVFRELYQVRQPLYLEVADAVARDEDDVVLAAAGVRIGVGLLERLGDLVPGDGPAALVSDEHVARLHGSAAKAALGDRLASAHTVPRGEAAKTVAVAERLWRELRLDRGGTIVALGGGSTTDVAGFVASSYLRGIEWVAVPTTLVGQVDAAIGGKTAVDVPEGKNLVGAFHWPAATVVDPALLETLPKEERRAGLAEVVKTGLLCGDPLWELPEPEQVRRCAGYKSALCLRDPHDRGPRNALNLGHTFAHALEAAAGYRLAHGDAVALGLLAALRLSRLPTDDVERVLRPEPAHVDPAEAWAAMARDKKSEEGRLRLVLLEAPGRPRIGVELPGDEVRAALDQLIAG